MNQPPDFWLRWPTDLDEHVDVVGDLQRHHFDLVLLSEGRMVLREGSGWSKFSFMVCLPPQSSGHRLSSPAEPPSAA